jgi:hypothetical protein
LLTIQPLRLELERRQIEAWENGINPSINRSLAAWRKEQISAGDSAAPAAVPRVADRPAPKARISWVSETAREKWQARLERLPAAIEELTAHVARLSGEGCSGERCSIRLVPSSSFDRLLGLSRELGLAAAILPPEALPGGICTRPAEGATGVFLVGASAAVANAQTAWARRDLRAFRKLIDLPACCVSCSSDLPRESPRKEVNVLMQNTWAL